MIRNKSPTVCDPEKPAKKVTINMCKCEID